MVTHICTFKICPESISLNNNDIFQMFNIFVNFKETNKLENIFKTSWDVQSLLRQSLYLSTFNNQRRFSSNLIIPMFIGTHGLYTDIFCTAGLRKLWIKCVIFIISFTWEILLRICNFFTVRSLNMLRSYNCVYVRNLGIYSFLWRLLVRSFSYPVAVNNLIKGSQEFIHKFKSDHTGYRNQATKIY